MPSIFENISYRSLWIAFLALLVLFMLVSRKARPAFSPEEAKKITGELGRGPMMALEFAGSPTEAERVLRVSREANAQAIEKFRTAIAWDYLFLFIYPAWIAAGCMIVAKFVSEKNLPGASLGLFLIIIQPLASLLDAAENYAMLRVLKGPIQSPWPEIARWCAFPKFAIPVLTGALYVICYGLGALVWVLLFAKARGR
ncbi:MAG TPA: hypothetical protein VF717_08600 [Pyrinomonadaceae bacterium]|jgi:hypothetical protein